MRRLSASATASIGALCSVAGRREQRAGVVVKGKGEMETHAFDAKVALPGSKKNRDLAEDVAAMAVDGVVTLTGHDSTCVAAAEARDRGWRVEEIRGAQHLHAIVAPAAVTDALLRLAAD